MAFKEVGGAKKYFKYNELEQGDVLVEGKFSKSFQGRFGVQYEYLNKCGSVHVLNSSGQLNYLMDFVEEGDTVKIVYDGTFKLTKGSFAGKDAHQFKLFRDDDGEEQSEVPDEDGLDAFDEFEE